MPYHGWCEIHNQRKLMGRNGGGYCHTCLTESKQRGYTEMDCKHTGKAEMQYVVRESEEGVTLRCGGCGKHHSHEIGEFAHIYQARTPLQRSTGSGEQ